MKKIIALLVLATLLSGCSFVSPSYYWNGKKQSTSTIEESIEDQLEQENGIEFNVTITEDTKTNKKKSSKRK